MRDTKKILIGLFALLLTFTTITIAEGARVKDIASIAGVRENQLIGYGLVVGLNKTGDNNNKSRFSTQTLVSMLEKLGTKVDIARLRDLKVNNIAAVMVTAQLPPFASPGMKIDITASSLGDAKSLEGGTLLLTPLKAGNGLIYAVAQGSLSVGDKGGSSAKRTRRHNGANMTVGKIPGGASVEKGIRTSFADKDEFSIILNRPDFTTAINVSTGINNAIGVGTATAANAGRVDIKVPATYKGKVISLVAAIESVDISVDSPARVILDERTGTVIIGGNVKLSAVAISRGDLTVKINPTPAANTTPNVTPPTLPQVIRNMNGSGGGGDKVILMPATSDINTLISALNAVGVSSKDLISIFQSLKAAGALQAELEII